MAEQGTHKPLVGGSNPPFATHSIIVCDCIYNSDIGIKKSGTAIKQFRFLLF